MRFLSAINLFVLNSALVVEVRVSANATARFDTIRNAIYNYITSSFSHLYLPSTLQGWDEIPLLASSVDRVYASESQSCPSPSLPLQQVDLQIHVYQPSDSDAFEELASGSGRGDGEEVMAASVCELPSLGWEGLWESLIYSDDIKSKLLDYIYATVVFSDADVDCEFSWYTWAVICLREWQSTLFPGIGWCFYMGHLGPVKPPCVVRSLKSFLSDLLTGESLLFTPTPTHLVCRYPHSRLLEINSHSLFSKWFSESGKLVQKLFSTVMDMVEDEETFVVVLIGSSIFADLGAICSSFHVDR